MAAGWREVGLSVLVPLMVFALAVGGVAAVWFPLDTMISNTEADGEVIGGSVLLMILGVGTLVFAVMIAIAFAGRGRQRHRTAGSVVALVAAAGVGAVFVVITYPGGLPDAVHRLGHACTGATYGNAAPYAGPAPHPVTVQMPSEVGQLLPVTPDRPDGSRWEAADPDDPKAVQLVACGEVESERSPALSCGPYSPTGLGSGVSVPLVRTTYRIRVYELRTHRELRSVVVEGEDTECPEWTSSPPQDRMLSELSAEQWQAVLDDLVNADLA